MIGAQRSRGVCLAAVAALALAACGGDDGPATIDAASTDGGPGSVDAFVAPATRLEGTLDGNDFVLDHALVQWPDGTNSTTYVCVTDVEVTMDQCIADDGPSRYQFDGVLFVPASGDAVWSPGNSGVFRVGSTALDLGSTATLDLYTHDPETGVLALSMTMQFWDAGNMISGTIRVP